MAKKRIVENWKGKRVFVARTDKGQLIAWRKVAGSGLTADEAREIFKENMTFYRGVKKTTELLSNLKEKTLSTATHISRRDVRPAIKKPSGVTVQYFVSGIYQNNEIVVRSNRVSDDSPIKTAMSAKHQAWERFLEQLHWYATGTQFDERGFKKFYDAGEGVNYIDKVKNLREGWVYYDKIRKTRK